MSIFWTLILGAIAFFFIKRRYGHAWTDRLNTQDRLHSHRDAEIAKIKRLTDRRY